MRPVDSVNRPKPAPSKRRWLDQSGQTLIEAALVMPFLVLVAMGVVELGLTIRNEHNVIRLTREASNLISRSTPIATAATAMTSVESGSVDFSSNSQLIFSVVRRGATVGSANYNTLILYQYYSFGSSSLASKLTTKGTGSFGGAPDYIALNSDTDTSLQVTNAPAGLAPNVGDESFITEIYSTNALVASLAMFGVTVPTQLYSIAYF
jgi:Flp pilus assembly protein TadG